MRLLSLWLQSRQAEEASCLIGDVMEVDEATTLADDVEEVAMFAGGGVSPFAGRAFAELVPLETNEQRAAGRVADVPTSQYRPSRRPLER